MAQIVLFSAVAALAMIPMGLHQVREGYVGVYFRGGAIVPGISEPGWHVKAPLLTTYEEVQVTVQTDKVNNVPCGTKGGVMIKFDQIEVVNRLNMDTAWQTVKNYTVNYDKTWIFDKIHHEVNQFCSKSTLQQVFIEEFDNLDEQLVTKLQEDCDHWAPGIEIIAIRVTKPIIPKHLMENYEKIESEKTKLQIATQQQKVTEQQAETRRKEAKIKAESEAEIKAIEMQRHVDAKESEKKIEDIQNQIYLDRERAHADAHYYKIQKMIEAEQEQLTPQYLKKLAIESFSNNTKVYFGESIPKFMSQNVEPMLTLNYGNDRHSGKNPVG